jgi:hypothetical protein
LVPVVEAWNEDLVALLEFHGQFPIEFEGSNLSVWVEAEIIVGVMPYEFNSIEHLKLLLGLHICLKVEETRDVHLGVEFTFLLWVNLETSFIEVIFRSVGVRGNAWSVVIFLVCFPSDFPVEEVIEAELIVVVFENAVGTSWGTDCGLILSQGFGLDQVSFTCGGKWYEEGSGEDFKNANWWHLILYSLN